LALMGAPPTPGTCFSGLGGFHRGRPGFVHEKQPDLRWQVTPPINNQTSQLAKLSPKPPRRKLFVHKERSLTRSLRQTQSKGPRLRSHPKKTGYPALRRNLFMRSEAKNSLLPQERIPRSIGNKTLSQRMQLSISRVLPTYAATANSVPGPASSTGSSVAQSTAAM